MDFAQLTTEELVRTARTSSDLTERELALLDRLQTALDEIDELVKECDAVHSADTRSAGPVLGVVNS